LWRQKEAQKGPKLGPKSEESGPNGEKGEKVVQAALFHVVFIKYGHLGDI